MMRVALTFLSLTLFGTMAAAQTPPTSGASSLAIAPAVPPGLAALRAHYSVSLGTADRAVTGQWRTSLAALEKSRAVAGDYEGAARARARREETLSLMGTDDGRIPVRLTVSEITSKGSGLTIGEAAAIATLSGNGAFLEWDISGDFKGWYEVMLTHAVGGRGDHTAEVTSTTGPRPPLNKNDPDYHAPLAGGWASFQNVSTLSRNEMVLRREIVSTGGWNAWRGVNLGRLEINGRLARLRLTVEDAAKEGVMHFRHLELVPSTPPAQGMKGSADKLAQARDAFVKDFRTQALAASRKYRAGLDLLEQQATRSKDTDAVVRVRNEKDALAKSPEMLALAAVDAVAVSPAAIKLDVGNSFNCTVRGDIRPDKERTALTGLRPANTATVTWRLLAFNVGSGTYQVGIKGRVPVNGGGFATLAAFGASSAAAGPVLRITIAPVVKPDARNNKPEAGVEPPTAQALELEVGELVISKGAESLVLTVTGLTHPDGSLMDLSQITLTRTGEVLPAKTPP